MKLRELIEQLQALTDDPDSEVFVQMLPPDGGNARKEDQSGPVVNIGSGDYRDPWGLSLGVYIEATVRRV